MLGAFSVAFFQLGYVMLGVITALPLLIDLSVEVVQIIEVQKMTSQLNKITVELFGQGMPA